MRTNKITPIHVMVIFICFIVVSLNVLSLYSTPNPEKEKKDLHKKSQSLTLSDVRFSREDKEDDKQSDSVQHHVIMNKPNIVNFQAMSEDKVNEQKYFAEREKRERERKQGASPKEPKLVKKATKDNNANKKQNKGSSQPKKSLPLKEKQKSDHTSDTRADDKKDTAKEAIKKNVTNPKNVSQLLVTDMV